MERRASAHPMDLPSDVVEEILSRLPVRSLIRFKSVCKSWCNLISTKDFTILHLNKYKPPPSNLLISGKYFISFVQVCLTSRRIDKSESEAEAEADGLPIVSSFVNYPSYPINKVAYLLVSGPCNGIVCLYNRGEDKNDLVLWNPAIQDFKIIPQSNLSRQDLRWSVSGLGFCFDPETNDYKILQIVLDYTGYQHHLYSFRTNSWRKLDYQTLNACFNIFYFTHQFTTNRKIGWLVYDSQLAVESRQYQIYVFDVSSETFDMIPISVEVDNANRIYVPYAFPFRESIAVVISRKIRFAYPYFEIWVLNDFSSTQSRSRSRSRSWSKLMLTTIEHVGLHQPLGFWEDTYIIYQDSLTGKLMLYDILNGDVVDLGLGDMPNKSIRSALVYKESLISISNQWS